MGCLSRKATFFLFSRFPPLLVFSQQQTFHSNKFKQGYSKA